MKASILCFPIGVALLFSACTSSTSTDTPVVSCYPTQSIETRKDSNGTVLGIDTTKYLYNGSHVLLRMSDSFSYDTLVYASGKLTTRTRYAVGSSTPVRTYTYSYTGDNLTLMTEAGMSGVVPYTITTMLTYSGGVLTSVEQSGNPNGNQHATNIVWSGGNLVSLDFDPVGMGPTTTLHLTVVMDTKKNNSRFYIPDELPIPFFCTNNIVTVTTTNGISIFGMVINAGDKVLDNSYTYTSEGEVSIQTEHITPFTSELRITEYSYHCM